MAWVNSVRYMQAYPTVYDLVTNWIPLLPKLQPTVFDAFVRYTRLSRQAALDAIRPNILSPPVVVVKQTDKPRYSHYPGSGDIVIVQRSFVHDAESAFASGHTRVRRLLESKILHEMVHWGWFKATLRRNEPRSKWNYTDFAWDFEREAWGMPLDVHTLGVADVIPDPLVAANAPMPAP
jgi:hypothetical protein